MNTLNIPYLQTSKSEYLQAEIFPLQLESTTIGRHPCCEIVLDHAPVSREHARIIKEPHGFFVEDIHSRNGTYLNGQKIDSKIRIYNNDVIRICEVEFSFYDQSMVGRQIGDSLFYRTSSSQAIIDESHVDERTFRATASFDVLTQRLTRMNPTNAEIKLRALVDIGRNLGIALDQVLPRILENLLKIFLQADCAYIFLNNKQTQCLEIRAYKHRNPQNQESFRISRSILEKVSKTKQAFFFNDISNDFRIVPPESVINNDIHSVMAIPILGAKQQEDCLGVLQVDSRSSGKKFNDNDLDLLICVAYQIAVAIENAQYHDMMIQEQLLSLQTRDVAIFSLAKLAESRDQDTGTHLERVQHYCRALVQEMASLKKYCGIIDAAFSRLIFQTSPLHDIGKVGIPDAVLLKPGHLDAHEFEIMKTHTTIGAATLMAASVKFPVVSFLNMAQDIAASHHERYDGTGYPNRLKGEEIPLAGRITALADVYDALTSKRVYKQAHEHESARQMIEESRGTHFDPDVVDAFVEREEQFLTIRNKFSENKD